MGEEQILQELIDRSLLNARNAYEIEAVHGGLNNRVFAINQPREEPRYIVRLRRQDARSMAEIDALSAVSDCPVAPCLLLLTHKLLVLDYVPGQPRPLERLTSAQLDALSASLACVHAREQDTYHPWPDYELCSGSNADLFRFRVRSLAGYASYAHARGGSVHLELAPLFARLDQLNLRASAWRGSDFCRLHGDLSFGNILWNGDQPGLIDWEYSRVGDAAEDLAYLLTEQAGGVERHAEVIERYSAAGGAAEVAERVPAYGLFTAIDSALWWADRGADGAIPVERVEHEIGLRLASGRSWLEVI